MISQRATAIGGTSAERVADDRPKSLGSRTPFSVSNLLTGPVRKMATPDQYHQQITATTQHVATTIGYISLRPLGTCLSIAARTIAPSSSSKPRVRTSDLSGPIWRGGKFTTAMT